MKTHFLLLLLVALLTACRQEEPTPPPNHEVPAQPAERSVSATTESMISRGEYLVHLGGCHDCHSPKKMTEQGPVPDPDRLLSGHPASAGLPRYDPAQLKDWALFNHDLTAAVGPWGVSFSANLTSDESGIGNWTEQQFLTALRKGKFKGQESGRDLLPPMPWQNFALMTDDDLKAVFAYLKSTRPVRNVVPAPLPPSAKISMK